MYRRYENRSKNIEGDSGNGVPPSPIKHRAEPARRNNPPRRSVHEPAPPPPPPPPEQKQKNNPLLSFIPSSVYNPENGKILGFLSAEDLLLIAMILMFLDSEEDGDNLMVYALLYVLASEWIDIDFSKIL